MALLYRSNAQSRVFEHALFQAGIAYRVYGGLRFFERQEIKHALAYLRLVGNQDDDGAFIRIVNFPTRGVGARSLEQLQEAAQARGVSLFRAVKEAPLSGRSGASLNAFVGMIEVLSAAANDLKLPELIEEILDKSGLRTHYQNEREGADRLENLNELVNAAAAFEPERTEDDNPDPLAAFLAHASLEAGEHEAGVGQDALQLMTVHAAKGLEFDVVFVSGLEEGLFPHEQSLSEQDGIEEERRLMYVAVTRARQRLYISHAQARMLHGQMRYGVVSRFINEIPESLCKWLTPPQRNAGFGGFSTTRRDLWADVRQDSQSSSQPYKVREMSPSFGGLPYAIGQNVRHAKFGEGVVLSCEGRGSDARVQVKFRNEGVKWLALEYAKLQAM
jgi:DNA helicase-2/ATP-dependent DNA helicase PcrA